MVREIHKIKNISTDTYETAFLVFKVEHAHEISFSFGKLFEFPMSCSFKVRFEIHRGKYS